MSLVQPKGGYVSVRINKVALIFSVRCMPGKSLIEGTSVSSAVRDVKYDHGKKAIALKVVMVVPLK